MGSELIRTFRHRLQHGVTELSSPFEPRAMPVYLLISALLISTVAAIFYFDFQVKSEVWRKLPFAAAPIAICGMILRRYGHPKIGGALEAVSLIYLQGVATVLILFPMTWLSAPFADAYLVKADAAFGFNWPDFAALFVSDQTLHRVAVAVYRSFEWQALLIVPALFIAGQSLRAWRFVAATVLAAIITIAVYPLIPAHGPAVEFGLRPQDYPIFGPFPWEFGPDLQRIKDGLRVISLDMIFGMVSVPSYHAASAIMFLWAAWGVKYLRLPFLLLNAALLPATIVIGVHYLIDVIAGLIAGAFAILLASRMVREIRPA